MFLIRLIFAALRSLKANFVRSILAIMGIVIGVGTVIAAVGVIEGQTREVLSDMEKIGSNVMWVRPGNVTNRGVSFAGVKPLLSLDVEELLSDPRVSAAAPEIQRISQIKYQTRNEVGNVVGTTPDFFDVFGYEADVGRLFSRADNIGRRRVAAVGYDLAQKLFKNRNPLGEEIRIGREPFIVGAVMKEKGLVGLSDFDSQIYIPVSRAAAIFNARTLTQICVRGADSRDQEAARTAVAKVLRRSHKLQLGERDDFRIQTQKDIFDQFTKFVSIFEALFFAISGISLVVGGFGIMNIMLVSVTERTREIGVRMALGAYRSDIMIQFLAESGMICVVGAPLGIGLGWMLNQVVEANLAPLKPVLAPRIILIAVSVAILTGIISGLYPAHRASKLDPVEALRYE